MENVPLRAPEWRALVVALKGPDIPAQGSALGIMSRVPRDRRRPRLDEHQ
jgi:hypothetical protein